MMTAEPVRSRWMRLRSRAGAGLAMALLVGGCQGGPKPP